MIGRRSLRIEPEECYKFLQEKALLGVKVPDAIKEYAQLTGEKVDMVGRAYDAARKSGKPRIYPAVRVIPVPVEQAGATGEVEADASQATLDEAAITGAQGDLPQVPTCRGVAIDPNHIYDYVAQKAAEGVPQSEVLNLYAREHGCTLGGCAKAYKDAMDSGRPRIYRRGPRNPADATKPAATKSAEMSVQSSVAETEEPVDEVGVLFGFLQDQAGQGVPVDAALKVYADAVGISPADCRALYDEGKRSGRPRIRMAKVLTDAGGARPNYSGELIYELLRRQVATGVSIEQGIEKFSAATGVSPARCWAAYGDMLAAGKPRLKGTRSGGSLDELKAEVGADALYGRLEELCRQGFRITHALHEYAKEVGYPQAVCQSYYSALIDQGWAPLRGGRGKIRTCTVEEDGAMIHAAVIRKTQLGATTAEAVSEVAQEHGFLLHHCRQVYCAMREKTGITARKIYTPSVSTQTTHKWGELLVKVDREMEAGTSLQEAAAKVGAEMGLAPRTVESRYCRLIRGVRGRQLKVTDEQEIVQYVAERNLDGVMQEDALTEYAEQKGLSLPAVLSRYYSGRHYTSLEDTILKIKAARVPLMAEQKVAEITQKLQDYLAVVRGCGAGARLSEAFETVAAARDVTPRMISNNYDWVVNENLGPRAVTRPEHNWRDGLVEYVDRRHKEDGLSLRAAAMEYAKMQGKNPDNAVVAYYKELEKLGRKPESDRFVIKDKDAAFTAISEKMTEGWPLSCAAAWYGFHSGISPRALYSSMRREMAKRGVDCRSNGLPPFGENCMEYVKEKTADGVTLEGALEEYGRMYGLSVTVVRPEYERALGGLPPKIIRRGDGVARGEALKYRLTPEGCYEALKKLAATGLKVPECMKKYAERRGQPLAKIKAAYEEARKQGKPQIHPKKAKGKQVKPSTRPKSKK